MRIVKTEQCYSTQIEAYGPSLRLGYTVWVLLCESHWTQCGNRCIGQQSWWDRLRFRLWPHCTILGHSGQSSQWWVFRFRWLGAEIGWRTLGDATPGYMDYDDAGLHLRCAWLPKRYRQILPRVAL